ncbi:zinc finger CCHC-type and RNA-binding motif-containing protein 1 [Strongylocentrotus purpuratus]|uniref:Zinc finger CCHC-type and RNA-binding motif-containing protein 1 n=1 Tax=Strongylocentrotus purpuratus TaxID=7668 RepID=A0A7M7RG89_STRPU|nr:zinc finger CCHC-type and RNA-binding motif-containing protein 1 [Strongylocentrotus purpuratus]
MSGGLAPSKSTVYVSNLPFTLTNNDLQQIFGRFGQVARVTIVKDKETRKSKGLAFVLFVERDSAYKSIKSLNGRELFGRKWKVSIADDNGRAADFIRRRNYPDKSRCYECGEFGHLSYSCPKNTLGDREPPPKKEKKKKKDQEESSNLKRKYYDDDDEGDYEDSDDEQEGEDPKLESLHAAISSQREKTEEEEYRHIVASGSYDLASSSSQPMVKRPKVKKNAYFSDEDEISD